jgi:hypothetical protein
MIFTIPPIERTWLIALSSIVLGPIVLYSGALACFCIPWVQRQSLYAHNIHTAWLDDLDDPESFGFASMTLLYIYLTGLISFCSENQVKAFKIKTLDGQTLYAWHILPRSLYAKYESELLNEKSSSTDDFNTNLAYKLLVGNLDSKLIINCMFCS